MANTNSQGSKLASSLKSIMEKSQKKLDSLSKHGINKERKIGNVISLILCFLLIGLSASSREDNWWMFVAASIICCAWGVAGEFVSAWWTKKKQTKKPDTEMYTPKKWVIIANAIMIVLAIAIIVERLLGIAKL